MIKIKKFLKIHKLPIMIKYKNINNWISLLILFFIGHFSFAQTTITYQPSTSDFANPERGFYRYSETRSSNYTFLDQSTLEGYRMLHTPPSAGYSIYSTLVFRYFFFEDFTSSNITQTYLDNMQTDFNTARLAGVKIIPRFAYTDAVNASGCASWICPPYGDAAKVWVLAHIAQLAPVLEANKDVIASVQMGLIGVWGENYYTDYFGDASQPPNFKLTNTNWDDRIEVLNALLNAVPEERMVQARYPQQKQRAIYGVNATTSSAALTLAEAFQGTDKARIGFHNDCLLASPDDFGTYTDYGNSSTSSSSDTLNLKPYFADDSQFVVVGGETCNDDYSPENDCASSNGLAYGDTELRRMHYSYLNSQYNNDVNNDWETGGCMDDIKKRLGYRFELQNGMYSNAAQPNQIIDININLKNVGYASPYNEREVEVMLRNTATSDVWTVNLPDDPRYWFADNTTHNISETLCLPSTIPVGTYELFLNLPDPMPTLHDLPEYTIRLANLLPDNSDVWEAATGYNKLGHTITIDNTSSNTTCNGELTFTALSPALPVTLINFIAQPKDKSITLKWSTASELNNKGFHIERSTDGEHFTRIMWEDGNGTNNTVSNYSAVDSDVTYNTYYYYRLNQIDLDGTSSYSKIVAAKVNSFVDQIPNQFENSIRIFPNPTSNTISIDWDGELEEIIEIGILNIYGVEIGQVDITSKSKDIAHLPKGIYFVQLRSERKEFVRRMIKW